jgi:hypothetical protein
MKQSPGLRPLESMENLLGNLFSRCKPHGMDGLRNVGGGELHQKTLPHAKPDGLLLDRQVNGAFRQICLVSCPLPANSTRSPALAKERIRAMAFFRSGSIAYRGGLISNPASISDRIVAGSSPRGLSEVTIQTSLNRSATRAIWGRFPRSLSPPHPKRTNRRLGLS